MGYGFCCPVCGAALNSSGTAIRCQNGHSYDIARQGYVNLLLSGGGRHGDDGAMVRARTAFLERGYYQPLLTALTRLALSVLPPGEPVLDAGCGEGYYALGLKRALREGGTDCPIYGADISRDAVRAAARRGCYSALAVASVSRLPINDGVCGGVLNIFSPPELGEYRRVLKSGGVLIRALPLEDHLFSLKAAVYDKPYLNPAPPESAEGFRLIAALDVREDITVSPNADIRALFAMTPYAHKTSPGDAARLDALEAIETRLSVRLAAFERL